MATASLAIAGPLCLLPLTRLLLKGPQQLALSASGEQSHEWVKENSLKGPQKPKRGKIEQISNSYRVLPRDQTWCNHLLWYGFQGKMDLTVPNGWGKKWKKNNIHQMLYNVSCSLLNLCIYQFN